MLTGDRLERGRQCFAVFDFCRTAEWWSIAGKTEEERSGKGRRLLHASEYARRVIE